MQTLARLGFWLALLSIVVLALMPVPPNLPATDKTKHVLAFMTLTALARIGYPLTGSIKLFLWLAAFGGAIELVQGLDFVGRDGDFADWLADLGAAAVVLLATTWFKRAAVTRAHP